MSGLRKSLPWLILALIAGLIWFFWLRPETNVSSPTESDPKPAKSSQASASPDETGTDHSRNAIKSPLARLIASSLTSFRNSANVDESRLILKNLREGILAADPGEAAAAIAGFLKTGDDTPTRLPFTVGDGGMMNDVSTLRLALLDLLPSLDPELALAVSREIMDQKTSPDEYALALRNLAWNDLNGDLHGEVIDRLNQMIQSGDWLARPSAGFLEAIDAAVFVKGQQSFEILVSLHQVAGETGDLNLGRASFVALDRVVLGNPDVLIQAFEGDPGLSGMDSSLRASLISRMDLTDAKQREVVTRYLSDPALSEKELDYFTGVFPNGNFIHGNWLMSGMDETQSIDQRKQSDLQVIAEIDQLRAAGGGERMIQALDRIKARLVRQTQPPAKE